MRGEEGTEGWQRGSRGPVWEHRPSEGTGRRRCQRHRCSVPLAAPAVVPSAIDAHARPSPTLRRCPRPRSPCPRSPCSSLLSFSFLLFLSSLSRISPLASRLLALALRLRLCPVSRESSAVSCPRPEMATPSVRPQKHSKKPNDTGPRCASAPSVSSPLCPPLALTPRLIASRPAWGNRPFSPAANNNNRLPPSSPAPSAPPAPAAFPPLPPPTAGAPSTLPRPHDKTLQALTGLTVRPLPLASAPRAPSSPPSPSPGHHHHPHHKVRPALRGRRRIHRSRGRHQRRHPPRRQGHLRPRRTHQGRPLRRRHKLRLLGLRPRRCPRTQHSPQRRRYHPLPTYLALDHTPADPIMVPQRSKLTPISHKRHLRAASATSRPGPTTSPRA